MTINPMIPMPLLMTISVLMVVIMVFISWKNSVTLSFPKRLISCVLCALTILFFTIFLINPCRLESNEIVTKRVDLVLVDTSSSMNTPMKETPTAPSRIRFAQDVVRTILTHKGNDCPVIVTELGEGSRELQNAEDISSVEATGQSSLISAQLEKILRLSRSSAQSIRQVFLLSDGRDTTPVFKKNAILVAQSLGVPIHTICTGEKWTKQELILTTDSLLISATPKATVNIPITLENHKMPTEQCELTLENHSGDILARQIVNSNTDENTPVTFSITAPATSGEFIIRAAASISVKPLAMSIRISKNKLRIFLAEGSPYWDSKFLAQLLSKQSGIILKSVHRLRDNRFYRIDTGYDESQAHDESSIPSSVSELMNYDIIILGKGVEHLFSPGAAEALCAYVRDFGGVVLFSRGKPYSGDFKELADIEPFVWGDMESDEYRITPSPEGEYDGLFGHVLPSRQDSLWSKLPMLSDVCSVTQIKSNTRVLARTETASTPLIAVRAVGLGAVAIINGDGLWKWDFFPEAKQLGNWYLNFWNSFLPWIRTACEFAPGYDLSLHVDRATIPQGTPLNVQLSWRSSSAPGPIVLKLFSIQSSTLEMEVTQQMNEVKNALPHAVASLLIDKPGEYILQASSSNHPSSPAPECRITVPSPLSEMDDLNADSAFMAELSEKTRGRILPPDLAVLEKDLPPLLKHSVSRNIHEKKLIPLWNRWYILLIVIFMPASAWWIRRCSGLL